MRTCLHVHVTHVCANLHAWVITCLHVSFSHVGPPPAPLHPEDATALMRPTNAWPLLYRSKTLICRWLSKSTMHLKGRTEAGNAQQTWVRARPHTHTHAWWHYHALVIAHPAELQLKLCCVMLCREWDRDATCHVTSFHVAWLCLAWPGLELLGVTWLSNATCQAILRHLLCHIFMMSWICMSCQLTCVVVFGCSWLR